MSLISDAIAPYRLYAEIGLAVAALAAFGGFVWHERSIGAAKCEQSFDTRDRIALDKANKTIQDLQNAARAKEQEHAVAQAAITTTYEAKVTDANKETERLRGAANAGLLILRDPARTAQDHTDTGSEIAASASGRDDNQGCRLSETASNFLLQLTGEADNTTRQLGACQQLLIDDRQ